MPSTSEVTIGGQTTTAQPVGDSVTLTGTAPTATGSQKLLGQYAFVVACGSWTNLRQFSDENSKGIEIAGNMGDDVRALQPVESLHR